MILHLYGGSISSFLYFFFPFSNMKFLSETIPLWHCVFPFSHWWVCKLQWMRKNGIPLFRNQFVHRKNFNIYIAMLISCDINWEKMSANRSKRIIKPPRTISPETTPTKRKRASVTSEPSPKVGMWKVDVGYAVHFSKEINASQVLAHGFYSCTITVLGFFKMILKYPRIHFERCTKFVLYSFNCLLSCLY